MDSTQIILCLCILLLRSAVAKPDFGQRAKRNVEIREYLERVVTRMSDFEKQLLQLKNALQLLTERYQELLEQDGKFASEEADLAIRAANQRTALQQRNAELTNQIEQLTNQTQELFRINAVNVKREEAVVKQNAQLTEQLAQFGEALNQTKELQYSISREMISQTAQMHNFSTQLQDTLKENVAEMRQSSKNQCAIVDQKIENILAESQENTTRAVEIVSQKFNLIEVLLKECTATAKINLNFTYDVCSDSQFVPLREYVHTGVPDFYYSSVWPENSSHGYQYLGELARVAKSAVNGTVALVNYFNAKRNQFSTKNLTAEWVPNTDVVYYVQAYIFSEPKEGTFGLYRFHRGDIYRLALDYNIKAMENMGWVKDDLLGYVFRACPSTLI